MKNSLKIRNMSFLMMLMIISTFSYGNDNDEATLWKAAKTNNFCRAITFKGMNADIYNEYGKTPLMVAVQQNNSRFINCLVKTEVDVLLKDNDGKTAFDYIKKPQSRREQIFSTRTYNSLRRLEVHQIIGNKARIVQEDINMREHYYKLYIEGARCEEFQIPEDIECIFQEKKKLRGTPYEIYKDDMRRGVPPIFAAIQNHHMYSELSEILDGGADIELKNKFGTTPLSFAIYQNDNKLVKILLEYGANPNVIDGNGLYTPLSEACVTNKIATVKLLLKYGADVNYQYNKSETALTVAVKGCKNFELVKLLLAHGANPKLIDRYGSGTFRTLKIFCGKHKEYEKMKKLLEDKNIVGS